MSYGDYYNPNNKAVSDGNIVYADDVNKVNLAVDAALEQVAIDLEDLAANSVKGVAIAAIDELTPAANTVPYFTSGTEAALTPLTAAGRALIDDASAADQRATLNLDNVPNVDCTNGSNISSGTVADARIASTITRDTEVNTATTSALALKADLISPTFTGVPLAPTAVTGTNTTQIATTAFVQTEVDKVSMPSIAQYGAKGDGGTTNNYQAIVDCIAANPNSIIFVPMDSSGGDYSVSTALILSSSTTFFYEAGARIYGTVTDNSKTIRFGGGTSSGDGGWARETEGLEILINNVGQGSISHLSKFHNYISIDKDYLDCTTGGGSKSYGYFIDHWFGDSTTKGGRIAFMSRIQQEGVTSATNTDRNYTSGAFQNKSTTGDSGTLGSEKGKYFALNAYVDLSASATNTQDCCAIEVNTLMHTGASGLRRTGISLACGGSIQGSSYDSAVSISGMGNVIDAEVYKGWRHAILIGSMNGSMALESDSTILECNQTDPIENAFAISTEITGYLLDYDCGDGKAISLTDTSFVMYAPGSNIQLGSLTDAGSSYIDFSSSGLNTTYDARLIASGGTASTGDGTLTFRGNLLQTDAPIRPEVDEGVALGTNLKRFSEISATTIRPGAGGIRWTSGTGSPEGVLASGVGSMYTRTDGGAGSVLYVKESGGTTSTGWVAK